MRRITLSALLCVGLALSSQAQTPVAMSVDTEADRAPISPYVYGTNGQAYPNMTAMRSGGNRLTGYNWETNASNAGADWYHSSDNYLTWILDPPAADETVPGLVFTRFHDDALANNAYSLITLQMAGYVAADKNGTVDVGETAPSNRWNSVVHRKPGGAYANPPDLNDGVVYTDEGLALLLDRYGPAGAAGAGGVDGYALDNEPALWFSTHPRIHPDKVGVQELLDRSVDLAQTIKDMDPDAEVFGPAVYGFWAYVTLQDAPDWPAWSGQYGRFIEAYLDQMEAASATDGRRLLDVLDVHWYPEPEGVYAGATDPASVERRIQAPRSLWDSTYVEDSWIGQWYSPVAILRYLNHAIDTYYPGTKLAVTEYDYGAAGHVSGGIAQADALGIFGREGVYFASKWGDVSGYVQTAYELYRNYDGQGGTFGDTRVAASTVDAGLSSIYASVDAADPTRLHLILINKHASATLQANVAITSPQTFTSGTVWSFDPANATIQQGPPLFGITGNTLSLTLDPHSVHHVVLSASGPANQPPAVAITSPNDGATVPEGDPVTIAADASDPDGSVAQVEFLVDGNPLAGCTDTSAPYACTWTAPAPGSYTLTARATDDVGAATTSAPIGVTVEAGGTATIVFQDGANGYAGTRDTYLNGGGGRKNKNRNYGGSSTLRLGSIYRTLLAWDVTALPPGAPVQSAVIRLAVSEGSTQPYTLYAVHRPWVENEASWNDYASGQGWQTPGADGSADRGTTPLGTFSAPAPGAVDVALNASGVALVQQWINDPSSNTGLILMSETASDGATFASRETGVQADRPRLSITYSTDGSGNLPPVADLGAAPTSGPAPLTVAFDASGSTDPDGTITGYAWDFGDGATSDQVQPNHTFAAGSHTVTLVVTDDQGATGTATQTITAEAPSSDPVTVTFSDPEDATLDAAAPDQNAGSATTLYANGNPARSAVFRWDVSAIPPGSTIELAELTLRVTDKSRTSFPIYALARPWTEAEVTWNDASAGQPWQSPGATGGADRDGAVLAYLKGKRTGTYTVALNQAGRDAVASWAADASANHGLILGSTGSASDDLGLVSGEGAGSSRPALTVRYRPPSAPQSAGRPGAAGLAAAAVPDRLAIESVYPNPFNPTTTLRFAAPEAGRYAVTVYNALGQRVFAHELGAEQPGIVHVRIALTGLSTGVYLARVRHLDTGRSAHAKLMLSQ